MVKDIVEQNKAITTVTREMAGLREYFPQCFDSEGCFDIDKFREAIDTQVDVVREGRNYDFLGKSYARMLSSLDTTTVLRPDIEHNSKPENVNSDNIYISGDNLDALQHLVNSYSGQVKCIYIDPPYNTGTDGFVYEDKFGFSADELEHKLSISHEEAEKIIAMTSGHRASHAAWLTFMMPRLLLARDLLKKEGVLFISIDDNEQAYLKQLCDFIYGEDNFLAVLARRTKAGGGSAAHHFAVEHDYVLVYARNANEASDIFIPFSEKYLKRYKYEDGIGKYFWDTMERSCTGTTPYKIEAPDGTMLEGDWFRSEKTFLEDKKKGDIKFLQKDNGEWSVQFKQRLPEGKKMRSILGDNDFKSSQDDLATLGMEGLFSHPKPVFLIKHLLQGVIKDGDIVIDFFSGSATTAHALLDLLNSYKNVPKFIMVQLPEDLDNKLQFDPNADKDEIKRVISFLEDNGYPHTLDYVGFERIKRAAKKIKEANPLFIGDLGFKHYTIEEVPQNTLDKLYTFDPTAILSTDDTLNMFGRETVLTTWLVRDGYGLTAKTREIMLGNYKATLCGHHLYMTDSGFTTDNMRELENLYIKDPSFNPDYIVLFGYSFSYNEKELLENNSSTIYSLRGKRPTIDIRY